MKINRSHLVILFSSIALLAVLIIQVNWILQTAQVKEELFNEKANMVLSKTADAVSADEAACQRLDNCVEMSDLQRIDSLFTHYMAFYHFPIDYSFEVKQSDNENLTALKAENGSVYNKKLEEQVSQKGLELTLFLPEKEQFILAEMGPLFITSVLLILLVFILFWRTTRSLIKEKRLSEQTIGFFNNMTHELKTPLTNIGLAGRMLKKETAEQEEGKIGHYTGIILQENDKLKQHVEEVLNMTGFDEGGVSLQYTTTDVHELIHDISNCMNVQIERLNGELILDLAAEKHTVHADKTHLRNVLSNLLDNAIKYSTKAPKIHLKTTSLADALEVQITDHGIGIPSQYLKKIFDRYFRVPTGDKHDIKGYGIGLSYVKKVVEMHGGKIEVKSEKGNGTTFILSLNYV